MKTLYAACLDRLGLSRQAAADLHGVRLDTVKSWSAGRNPVPSFVWVDLRAYAAAIEDRRDAIEAALEQGAESAGGEPTKVIDIRVPDDPMTLMAVADFALTGDVDPELINIIEAAHRENA